MWFRFRFFMCCLRKVPSHQFYQTKSKVSTQKHINLSRKTFDGLSRLVLFWKQYINYIVDLFDIFLLRNKILRWDRNYTSMRRIHLYFLWQWHVILCRYYICSIIKVSWIHQWVIERIVLMKDIMRSNYGMSARACEPDSCQIQYLFVCYWYFLWWTAIVVSLVSPIILQKTRDVNVLAYPEETRIKIIFKIINQSFDSC